MDLFLTKNVNCKLCGNEFSTQFIRKSKLPVVKTDSDFCVHYEQEIPFYYNVLICPECGYGFLDSFAKNPDEKMHEKISPLPDDFSGKRDNALAEKAYQRVIECAKRQKESDAVLASLHLQMAWIFRIRGDQENELTMLNEALGYYIDVYEKSDIEDPSKVIYLIGELNRRLGKNKEAVFWFNKVANDEQSNKAMRRMARQAWQSLRD